MNLISRCYMKKNKVMFISSTGGHLDEMMQLKTMFNISNNAINDQ